MLDEGEVETISHYYAAAFFEPDVECILDIGGQDMKLSLIHISLHLGLSRLIQLARRNLQGVAVQGIAVLADVYKRQDISNGPGKQQCQSHISPYQGAPP